MACAASEFPAEGVGLAGRTLPLVEAMRVRAREPGIELQVGRAGAPRPLLGSAQQGGAGPLGALLRGDGEVLDPNNAARSARSRAPDRRCKKQSELRRPPRRGSRSGKSQSPRPTTRAKRATPHQHHTEKPVVWPGSRCRFLGDPFSPAVPQANECLCPTRAGVCFATGSVRTSRRWPRWGSVLASVGVSLLCGGSTCWLWLP